MKNSTSRIQPITTHIAQLALTASVLPQRAACALHLVYAIQCGGKFTLNVEEYLDSLSGTFTQAECDVRKFSFAFCLVKKSNDDENRFFSSSFGFLLTTVFSMVSSCSSFTWFKRYAFLRSIDRCDPMSQFDFPSST